ncbi:MULTISPECIES: COX15/CtaA family protein [Ramlibacter]|uniref:COX15/CtaA family protein n=1 Tax=Ramlibacter aquaticus TaxID=2780094 RepID=A0ABR9SDC1_9BURK|nr:MULTISPECIES: COX15/CtaA family protein [Ramlibacter]MBE7940291.1 COX15/CtaA family protein [Ramlibacter aquaticus]
MDTPLYNLSPVLHLLLMGLAVATGPLAWVWLRNRSPRTRLAALTLLTLFLTFDLVMFGAFTRLTDSGLGCPDWPGCYGHASPVGASSAIASAQAQMPTGPVTHTKAWIEMVHRYLAMGVGTLILTLTLGAWRDRRRGQGTGLHPLWPTLTLGWVCLQGAFGALTVTMKLFPAIVTLHLMGGVVLLALLAAQATRLRHAEPATVPSAQRGLVLAGLALLALQIALGGWVSTNYAVLACNGFPACQGSFWPAMDFAQGFTLWRPLGLTPAGEPVSFEALTAIHYVHRLAAYAVIAALGLLAWRLRAGPLRTQARWLGALLALQFATGLSNVVLGWPLVAAVLHTGGAAAMVAVLTWAWFASVAERAPVALRSAARREVSA